MPVKTTKEYYDSIARGYNELYRSEQLEKFKYIPKLKGTVLDIGAGTGLLNEFIDVTLSADLSHNILKLNSNKMKICCSVTHLPFKTNTFENVLSITVLQDLNKSEIQRALREIKRVSSRLCLISFLAASQKTTFLEDLLSREYKAHFINAGRDTMVVFYDRKGTPQQI